MSNLKQFRKASPVQVTHPSEAPLPTPTLRNDIGSRVDGNIESDPHEDLYKAIQKLIARYCYCLIK